MCFKNYIPFLLLTLCMSGFLGLTGLSSLQGQNLSPSPLAPLDSMGFVLLEPIKITPNPYAGMDREARMQYRILRRNVSKVYPYALEALELMIELEEVSVDMKRRDKNRYRKKLEKQLKEEFKGELKKLTRSQGKLLIDMIERHCDQHFYAIIKDLKNPTTAYFWQRFGKAYGYDLKEGYDPAADEQLEMLLYSYKWPDKKPVIVVKEKKAKQKKKRKK